MIVLINQNNTNVVALVLVAILRALGFVNVCVVVCDLHCVVVSAVCVFVCVRVCYVCVCGIVSAFTIAYL